MASLILPETSEKLSRDSCFPSKHEMDKSYKKKNTYPKVSKIPPINYRKSKSTCSINSSKNRHKIKFSDFWSNKMKAEVKSLEKQMMLYSSSTTTSKNTRQDSKIFPEIRKNYLKSNEYYSARTRSYIAPNDLIPTIEKIIVDCDLVRKKTRRLSFELSTSNKLLIEEFSKFPKNRDH